MSMKLIKKGFIYCPNREMDWMQHSFMTPVPILIENKIRIFGGIRDNEGISRIGYIDVKAENPSEIIYIHKKPVLNIGDKGCFDDNGVILGTIVNNNNKWMMYYVGFQNVKNVKFYAFSGIAESKDLIKFKRKYQTPILDRKDWMKFIGAIHSVIIEDNRYMVWYAAGNGWKIIDKKIYPKYEIFYTESKDGIKFDFQINKNVIKPAENEYRIGRPTVYKKKNIYRMFCTRDTISKNYGIAYFESNDGINWVRMDEIIEGFDVSRFGWDSEMMCYPTLLSYKNKTYCFYNGNGMGKTGVGYSELVEF